MFSTHLEVAKESTSSRKMMQPGSTSAALNTSDSRRSLSPYHLEATASRGTYTRGTEAWLAITLQGSSSHLRPTCLASGLADRHYL